MKAKRVLVVGFGMAAQRLLEELAPLEVEGLKVALVSEEPCVAYDRIRLSSALAQAASGPPADLSLKPLAWHQALGHELHLGDKVVSLDLAAKLARTAKGLALPYDELVLATGSQPIVPALPGIQFPGVHVFRRLSDCQALAAGARPGLKAVVVGGGLLGLEAAKGLLNLGCEVTVVHLASRLMERQLDARAAALLQADLEEQGIRFELEASTEALLGGARIHGLRLATGRELPAEMVVFAIGVRPEVELAKAAGLAVKRGVVVDDHMRASAPGVWALGECAEHRGIAYGLVAPLYEQAATLAKRLAGMELAPYQGSKVYTRLKVAGLEVFSCGDLSPMEGGRDLILEDGLLGQYKRALVLGGRLRGAILYGDSSASNRLLKALEQDLTDAELRAALGLGGPGGAKPLDGMAAADLVCNCNQVALGTLREAVRQKGCRSVESLGASTAAGTSCGSCKPLLRDLLQAELAKPTVKAPLVTARPAERPQPVTGGLPMVGAGGGVS